MDKQSFSILVVDDSPVNLDMLVEILGQDYDVCATLNGENALAYVADELPDLVLLDIVMPEMDGYEVCQRLKADPKTRNIPVIFLTAMTDSRNEAQGLAMGAVDYITKPFSAELVKARVNNHLQLKQHRDRLLEMVEARTRELSLTQEVTIYSLAGLAETRDPETGSHILRTQQYVRALARQCATLPEYRDLLDDPVIELMYKSAPLHDIGKVGIPDRILLKPAKLTPEEFEIMKLHTVYGRNALRVAEEKLGSSSFLKYAGEIAYTHHEKWDGSGYPEGLSGKDIPLSGRLMAIADVYDALISQRVYKPPFSHSKAVSNIEKGKGSHFDPVLITEFLKIQDEFKSIALNLADSPEEQQALLAG